MEHSEAIAELLPGAELVILEEAGHLVILEHPEVVNGHLTELLSRAVDGTGDRAKRGVSG
ncbi:Lipase OS=Streptomyces antimycoticus OX=68175 GN=SANT12839_055880 PE=4 SV=1 [Streptomyces antimycoticus]